MEHKSLNLLLCFLIILAVGYVRSDGTTLSFSCGDINCAVCNKSQHSIIQCIKCEYGYILSPSQSCKKVVCLDRQYISLTGVCLPCHSKCTTCYGPTDEECTQCLPGYYEIPSIIQSKYLVSCWRCQDPNCDECDRVGSCLKCIKGYTTGRNSSICQRCPQEFADSCDSVSSVSLCSNGFIKSEDGTRCLPIIFGNCLMGYYEDSHAQCHSCSPPCQHCINQNQCYVCPEGYFINLLGQCELCSQHCLICSSANTCTLCESTYEFVSTGCVLIDINNLRNCPTGEYANETTNICIKCPTNCFECENISANCISCLDEINFNLIDGKCVSRCQNNQIYYIENNPELFISYTIGQRLQISTLIGTCKPCFQDNCNLCGFSDQFCIECAKTYFSYQGKCLLACPQGTSPFYNIISLKMICVECPFGCVDCFENRCLVCTSDYLLNNGVCENDGIQTSRPYRSLNKVNIGLFWMKTCPRTTIQVGIRCLPMSSCEELEFKIDVKEIHCIKCNTGTESFYQGIQNLPDLSVNWFGKCYSSCPIDINEDCISRCDASQYFVNQQQSITKSCSTTQECQNPYLNRYCITNPICSDGFYLDIFKTSEQLGDVNIKKGDGVNEFCKPCPNGCKKCLLDGTHLICLECLNGLIAYEYYSMFNPIIYNNDPSLKLTELACKNMTALSETCGDLAGFYKDLNQINLCRMCLMLDQTQCKACQSNDLIDVNTNQCVPFCKLSQTSNGILCYDRPTLVIDELFGLNVIALEYASLNIEQTAFDFTVTITSIYQIGFKSLSCSLSDQNINLTTNAQIVQPSPKKLVLDVTTADPRQLRSIVNSQLISITCSAFVSIDNTFMAEVVGSKSNIQQIVQPDGEFSVTPTTGNRLTFFKVSVGGWNFYQLIKVFKYSIFDYEIFLLVSSSKDPIRVENSLLLQKITLQTHPELYPSDSGSLTFFTTFVREGFENQAFDTFFLMLRVTPTSPLLAHLVQEVRIQIQFTFERIENPKNTQPLLILPIFATLNDKPAIKQVAKGALIARGSLPIDQEQLVDLNFYKQSNLLSKVSIVIPCDNSMNCNSHGTCKILNTNWYSMCHCDSDWAGEQCDWRSSDLANAKSTLSIYLQTILGDLILLEQPTTIATGQQGILSLIEIVSLLQLWTDARDSFDEKTFETIIEILSMNTVKNCLQECERLLYVLDNMMDILRKLEMSQEKFQMYEKVLMKSIEQSGSFLMRSLDPLINTQITINSSNFKGLYLHNAALSQLDKSIDSLTVTLPNSIRVTVPKNLLTTSQYLEILQKPLDMVKTSVIQTTDQLSFVLSNPISITIRDFQKHGEQPVGGTLSISPLTFDMPLSLPPNLLTSFKNLSCAYWNSTNNQWENNGISLLSKDLNLRSFSCATTHLTLFAIVNFDWKDPTLLIDNPFDTQHIKHFNSVEGRIPFIVYLSTFGIILLGLYCASLQYTKEQLVFSEQIKSMSSIQGVLLAFISPESNEDDEDETLTHFDLQNQNSSLPPINPKHISKVAPLNFLSSSSSFKPSPATHPPQHPSSQQYLQQKQKQQQQQIKFNPQQKRSNASRLSKHLNYPTEYRKPQNSLQIEDNNMNYIYKKQFLPKPATSSVIIEEVLAEESPQQKLQMSPPPQKTPCPRKIQSVLPFITSGESVRNNISAPPLSTLPNVISQSSNTPLRTVSSNPIVFDLPLISKKDKFENFKNNSSISRNSSRLSNSSNASQIPSLERSSKEMSINDHHYDHILSQQNNKDIIRIIMPYLSFMSWKYSFINISNTERVLLLVVLLSMLLYTSSYYIQVYLQTYSREVNINAIFNNSITIIIYYELITWIIVVFVTIWRLCVRQICSCVFSQKNRFSTIFSPLICFILAFFLFSMTSYCILGIHGDLSIEKFILLSISVTLGILTNFILEFIFLYITLKANINCLFAFLKYKRLDF